MPRNWPSRTVYWPARDKLIRLIGHDDINYYWDHIFASGIDMIHWALHQGADVAKHTLDDNFMAKSIFDGGPDVIRWVAQNPVVGPRFANLLQNCGWIRRRLLFDSETVWLIRSVVTYFGSRSPALLFDLATERRALYLQIAVRHKIGSRELYLADHGVMLRTIASHGKKIVRQFAVKYRLSPSDFASAGIKFPS